MTKEILQAELDKKNIQAKVLLIRKTEFSDYEVIFTRDLNYSISETELSKRGSIAEPEEDALVEDLEDAVFQIKYFLSVDAWYNRRTSKDD